MIAMNTPQVVLNARTLGLSWAGITGIEVTPGGRLFVSCFSGGDTEPYAENTAFLTTSGDEGRTFAAPVAMALPPLGPKVKTTVNFEATLGGHNKFWWANMNGAANRETYDVPTEARLYPRAWRKAEFR